MKCIVYIAPDNELYTNFDFKDEVRAAKLKLLGHTDGIIKHDYNFLHTIEEKCETIILCNTTDLVAPYTFAFEEIFRRVPIEKIETYRFGGSQTASWVANNNNIDYNIPKYQSLLSIEDTSIYWSKDKEYVQDMNWRNLFYLAWTRFYNIPGREEKWDKAIAKALSANLNVPTTLYKNMLRLHGSAHISLESFIVEERQLKAYNENMSNFHAIDRYVGMHRMAVNTITMLAKNTQYAILPMRCSRGGEYSVFVSKDWSLEDFTYEVTKAEEVADAINKGIKQ